MIQGIYKCFEHWSERGAVWLYSDPHFGSASHFGYPSDEEQIKNINSKVGKKDTLIILGDVGDESRVKELKGYKILIKGNHDKGSSRYQRKVYSRLWSMRHHDREQAFEFAKEEWPGCKISVSLDNEFYNLWVAKADNMLFDEVYEGPLMIAEKLLLSHEPILVPWAYNIHGHDHVGVKEGPGHLNVCANVINFEPINLNKLMREGALKHVQSLHEACIAARRK